MSVTASCDTETTSAHLAGGPTTTIAVAKKFFLLCGFHCIGIVQTDRIVFMGFIFHVSSGENYVFPGDWRYSQLHSASLHIVWTRSPPHET
jgi:hypothetical protein